MPTLSELQRQELARNWRLRWQAEVEAGRRFEVLARRLESVNASASFTTWARQAAHDEIRHADLCIELVSYFGGSVQGFDSTSASLLAPIYPSSWDTARQLMYEMVALSCITESISVKALAQSVDQASDPFVRERMHSILVDEVRHSRLGWAYLESCHLQGDFEFLSPHLVQMLRGTAPDELFRPSDFEICDSMMHVGVLSHGQRRLVFQNSLAEIVLPGLAHFGMNIREAQVWLGQMISPSD